MPSADQANAGTRRGRPRSESARSAILAAATELLLERGLRDVSMDAIAQRAGVSKATIYRWWPTKEVLALDALYRDWDTSAPPPAPAPAPGGSLRDELLSLLRPWVARASSRPYGRVIAALLTEASANPEFGRLYRERFIEPRREPANAILTAARDRGELPADRDLEATIDILYGPLYHRLLQGHAPLDERFIEAVVDAALHA